MCSAETVCLNGLCYLHASDTLHVCLLTFLIQRLVNQQTGLAGASQTASWFLIVSGLSRPGPRWRRASRTTRSFGGAEAECGRKPGGVTVIWKLELRLRHSYEWDSPKEITARNTKNGSSWLSPLPNTDLDLRRQSCRNSHHDQISCSGESVSIIFCMCVCSHGFDSCLCVYISGFQHLTRKLLMHFFLPPIQTFFAHLYIGILKSTRWCCLRTDIRSCRAVFVSVRIFAFNFSIYFRKLKS